MQQCNFNLYFIGQFSIVSGKSDDNNNRKNYAISLYNIYMNGEGQEQEQG